MNKEDSSKEKFKQALISTLKVISEDFKIEKDKTNNLSSKNYNFFEVDNLSCKEDYIKHRAETDSEALKRKFSNKKIYKKNLPIKTSCKLLYDVAEKIRYEVLGTKMLNGISKNLKDNYSNKISLQNQDELKSKDDVKIAEAFELYMLKKFLGIELNSLSENKLSYWKEDFQNAFGKHFEFLYKNLENQEVYNSKFSEILENMDIFDSESNENDDQSKENEEQDKNNSNNEDSQDSSKSDQSSDDHSLNEGLEGIDDVNEFKLDEQMIDSNSENKNSENIIQKINNSINNNDYKVFTSEFDEISKAENLENQEEVMKLRKNLDQQLTP